MSLASITVGRAAISAPRVFFDDAPAAQTTPTHVLVAEIAERLEELEEVRKGFGADLIGHLAAIARRSRRSFEITVQLLHRNYDDVLASYQDQADARGITKQQVHWEFMHELEKIRDTYPEVYAVVMSTRAQALRHEDPQSKADALHSSEG